MLCTMTDQLACIMASYYKVFNVRLSTTPMPGMLFIMSDLMECIRDCSMLYIPESAQFLPVYYPTLWYVVYTMSDLMECIRDCSILYVLQSAQFLPVYYPTEWYVVYNGRLLV